VAPHLRRGSLHRVARGGACSAPCLKFVLDGA
jgi:hypothetical protein